jgi:dipeptidyl aminopeptidase/acylaminoacyl peptidase
MLRMLRRVIAASAACLLASVAAAAVQLEKRGVTETDLLAFTWVGDAQISPDGSTIAFVKAVVNARDNRYETAIYAVPAAGGQPPRPLTSGTRDTSPRWSPDGKTLAFVRVVEKRDGPSLPQLHVLPLDGGEARMLTDLPRGATGPVWAPDGRTLAFSSTATAADLQPPPPERRSDVRVVDRPVYRENGNPDYVDTDRRAHVWTVRVGDSEHAAPTRVTDGPYDESNIGWSRDGSRILFVSDRRADPYFYADDSDLYSVPAAGGEATRVASIDGVIGRFAVSNDGRRIAFVGTPQGNPIRSYDVPDLFVVDADGKAAPRNLTDRYDYDIGGGVGGDQAAPRGAGAKPIVWTADDRSLLVVASERGSANVKRIAVADARIEAVTEGAHDVMSFTASRDASTLAAVISSPVVLGDVNVVRAAGAKASPLAVTHFNDALFAGLNLTQPEEIWYPSFDGKRIHGWILKPAGFDARRRYPMILEIHGGPHSAYGNTFTHEFAWMAAKGYVVLYTNPRGSSSYGQDFGNIIQYHYPGDDYRDLMAGVDEVLKRGYVDAQRLGVTGGSGGGLLTNWTITQTQRFKAAVSQRDIADWAGFWYSADFAQFTPSWFRKAPWEDPQDFAARSPITHVAKVTTPLMLILGDQDYRTPPGDGGEQMFRALQYRRVPSVMVRFPRENHELSRAGEPWHRVERLRHILGWMDRWLNGSRSPSS